VRKIEEWFDLFTDDVLYFMPRRKNVPRRELHREPTPLGDLAILEGDRRYLEMQVARLDAGMDWAEDPPSYTRHLIGKSREWRGAVQDRVSGVPLAPGDGSSSPPGCREDAAEGERRWKMRRRAIVLDANVVLDKNLSIFL
jgi:3-phenylpropionate/cinnamic acid dioxygenase small subunit